MVKTTLKIKTNTNADELKLTSSTNLMCALICAASCVRVSVNEVKCVHFLSMKLSASIKVNSTKNPNPTHTKIFDGSGLNITYNSELGLQNKAVFRNYNN